MSSQESANIHRRHDAAVAVIEWMHPDGESDFLLLQRARRSSDPWSGQLAFPGGRVESGDADLFATCVRETWEECALRLERANCVATLPLAYAGRHHGNPLAVQPFHFRIHECPDLVLDAREMEAAFWVRRSEFSWAGHHGYRVPLPGMRQEYPGFAVGSHFLWGFTYGVLRDLVGFPPGPPRPPGSASAYA